MVGVVVIILVSTLVLDQMEKSVIDYFTTSIDLLNRVHLFKVRHLTEFSIHSLTELTLKLNFSLNIESETQNGC